VENEHPSWERWQAELAADRRPVPTRRQVGLQDDPDAYAAVGMSLWCDAWLRGEVSLDDAADHVASGDVVHLVDLGEGPEALIVGLGRLRALGATGAGAALPVPGDPVGLAGPPAFNHAALEAEEAVLLEGTDHGLVPERVGSSVTWHVQPATTRRPMIDPGEADRGLRAALPRAADELAALDVARWRPEVADALLNLRREQHLDLPPHVAARSARMLVLGLRCLDIVALATQDDGGAVTAGEAGLRRAALEDLGAAARRAVVAATCAPSY
jgi:hypothetical protein